MIATSSGLFVTGTDTGVGKTVIAAGVLAQWRADGLDAVPMKPVQTGCRTVRGRLVAPDLAFCLRAVGLKPGKRELADMAPYCFKPACSPHLAAKEAGVTLSIPVIERAFRRLSRAHEAVVVEGAGGVLVPLNERQTTLDLMIRLRLPVLLVARPGLGTINHTLLSLRVLHEAGLTVLGVVLNQAQPGHWGRIENDNCRTIERLGRVKVLGCLRYGAGGQSLPDVRSTAVPGGI
jgi:dethiobiotin synthetase